MIIFYNCGYWPFPNSFILEQSLIIIGYPEICSTIRPINTSSLLKSRFSFFFYDLIVNAIKFSRSSITTLWITSFVNQFLLQIHIHFYIHFPSFFFLESLSPLFRKGVLVSKRCAGFIHRCTSKVRSPQYSRTSIPVPSCRIYTFSSLNMNIVAIFHNQYLIFFQWRL